MIKLSKLIEYDLHIARLIGAPSWHTISGFAWKLRLEGSPVGFVLVFLIDPVFWAIHRVFGFGRLPHCKWSYEKETRDHLAVQD